MVEFAQHGDATSPAFRRFAEALYQVVPDLQTFNVRAAASYGNEVPWEYVGYGTGYALAWSAVLLLLASVIFQFREFK